jgi:2-polyprenyl-3-methyl-5-hydroxy-6-metoxy-1,4-benzoquinol methylase
MHCLLCGHDDFRHIYADNDLVVVKCRKCGLVFQRTEDTDAGSLEDYYRERPMESRLKWSGSTRRVRDVSAAIAAAYPGGKLLDVGCGSGEFLNAMSQAGLKSVGLEPNSMQAEFARRQGLTVVNEPLKEGLFPPAHFDAITFIQVLEHVPDPVQTLRITKNYLRHGGMLVIDVPSYNNPRFLLYRATGIKRIVRKDFIGPHLFYYTPRTLSDIVRQSGLEVLHFDTGRYNAKFGPNPLLQLVDGVARRFEIGGILLYATNR